MVDKFLKDTWQFDIIYIPKNRIPNPKIISPMFFILFDLLTKTITNPIPIIIRDNLLN